MAASAHTLRHTPLVERHAEAGAKLVPFAGWEMPVQYEGVRQEHVAVRKGVGIFDVSHMGEIETRGPGAADLLQRLLSNDVSKIAVGGAQYSVLCKEDGGVLDDLFTYRLAEDRYLTVTNAANHAKDLAWFQKHAATAKDAEVIDRADAYAMVAVQGPGARENVAEICQCPLPGRFKVQEMDFAGAPVLVCGTGYTGEDGVELLVPPHAAVAIWDLLVHRGATPTGLAARDTLRLEACFHLYGNDLSEDRDPIGAGLGWCCKEDTGFIGADAIAQVRAEGPAEKLVPFKLTGPGIARQGNPALVGGLPGVVTSGTLSPCLEVGIGMAYLPADRAEPGTEFEIDVRGKARTARVETKPLYPPKETDG